MGNGREHLCRADVGPAEHAHPAVRMRQGGGPLHRVVPVTRLVLERVPLAFGGVAAPDILDDDDVSAGGCLQPESVLPVLVVGRALEEHGEATLCTRSVDVSPQGHTVAHLHGHVGLEDNSVWLSGRPDGRGEQQIHQCDAGDNTGSEHDAVLPFEKPRQRIRTVAPHACAAARGCPDDHTRVDGATLPTQDR